MSSRRAVVATVKSVAKRSLKDLALFGGAPAFTEPLYVGRPNIGDEEKIIGRLRDILKRRWLSNNGPYVQEFERELAKTVGVKHCIAMCNATIALEIAIRASGMTGEVIVPSFTFVATAHSLQWQEITPVFCDVDLETHNIDPEVVEKMITPKTSGIIGVHLWGRPCDIDALQAIARKRNLHLLFDAAHAFGSSYKGQMIGGFGEAEVFSFHATKFLNSFEGGAIATNSDSFAEKVRLMANFGFRGFDNVVYVGTNGKMTEICAAMGISSLESLQHFVEINQRNFDAYSQELKGMSGVRLLTYDKPEKSNFQYVIAEIDESITGISRDRLVEILHAENVIARKYFFPGCHRMEPYRSLFPHSSLLLPNTEHLKNRVIAFPTGTAVTVSEIRKICDILRIVLKSAVAARRMELSGRTTIKSQSESRVS